VDIPDRSGIESTSTEATGRAGGDVVPVSGRTMRSTWVVAGLLLLVAGTLAFQEIRDLDIGFHLKAGRWMWENLAFPGNDVFTYTITNRYIDLYWLYQLFLAGVDAVGGAFALVSANALLVMVGVAIVMLRARRLGSIDTVWFGVAMTAGIFATAYQFTIRPHVFSWIFLGLMLYLLEEYYQGRTRRLWPMALVMLLWTNTHTLFVLGWIVLFCYAVGISVRDRRIDLHLLLWGAVSVAVSFLNPYFLDGVLLPLQQFGFLQQGNLYKELIAEYMSPFRAFSFDRYMVGGSFVLLQPTFFFHLYLLLALVGIVARIIDTKGRRLHEILLLLFFTYILLSAFKNIGYFIVATLPIVIQGLAALGRRFRSSEESGRGVWTFRANIAMAVVLTVAFLGVRSDAYYVGYRGLEMTGWRYSTYKAPIAATEFIRDHHLTGRILNHFNFGGILMNMLPQKVFIDGRNEVIGEEFFAEYSRMFNREGRDYILAKYHPDIVIFPFATAPNWQDYFRKRPDFRLVFVDGAAAVYLRRGYAEEIPALDQMTMARRAPSVTPQEIDRLVAHEEFDGPVRRLFDRQYYPRQEIDLFDFCLRNEWPDAALAFGVEGLRSATVETPELFQKVGTALRLKGNALLASKCYDRYLKSIDDPGTRRMAERLRRAYDERRGGGREGGGR